MIPVQGEDIGEEESQWYGLAGCLWGLPSVAACTYLWGVMCSRQVVALKRGRDVEQGKYLVTGEGSRRAGMHMRG